MTALSAPARILLVEDSPADVRLAREVLDEAEISYELYVAGDGETAMRMLRDPVRHTGGALPDIVLLDLNLPRKSGREVLAEIKADSHLCRVPVLILSTSASQEDVEACYQAHANAYLTKPVDWTQFVRLASALRDFWFMHAQLPSETAH